MIFCHVWLEFPLLQSAKLYAVSHRNLSQTTIDSEMIWS